MVAALLGLVTEGWPEPVGDEVGGQEDTESTDLAAPGENDRSPGGWLPGLSRTPNPLRDGQELTSQRSHPPRCPSLTPSSCLLSGCLLRHCWL